tara:strand:- start:3 stop:839 length:837 start_codon:yes stop_codon:yes gene_type:complete
MIQIKTILDIYDNYDNFIIDQWGVMHDGTNGYKHAIETIEFLKQKKKNLFIISNSSKRKKSSEEKLPKLGFKKSSFINVLTSGEMIWNLINKKYLFSQKDNKCFHIFDDSKEDGLLFREGLKLSFVNKIEDADFILACTPFSNMQPIDYVPILNTAIEKKLIMYCANPDFETLDKNSENNIICMGAISEIYNKMGGVVIIKGKPEIDIYIETTKSINLDKTKTVAVGDSLFHDIMGANNFSIDSILVKSGIHKDLEIINMLCKNHQISPTYLIDDFTI